MTGLVIRSTGSWITVRLEDGSKLECKLKGQFRIKGIRHTNPVAIGDHVGLEYSKDRNTGTITAILPRDNYIIRKATKLSRESHIIAANLDHAFLVVTLAMPRTSNGFIDRFLVTAEGYYIPASLIFNKTDIYDQNIKQILDKWIRIYSGAGYPCYRVSALTGENVEEVYQQLAHRVSLFAGLSGSGKSALIKAMEPGLNPKIGKISDVHGKGMHTTTFAEMYELNNDGFIVDTPGIKEFGLIDFGKEEIPRCFPEMDRLLPECAYANCSHIHEPDCAVKRALETGEVSRLRYNSYLSILNDD
jgi:ribosome biogenesis GTPase